jgi:hypothetical protein
MSWWESYRERNAAGRARIAERPVAAWVVHSITFTAFAFVLQRLRGGEVDWVSPAIVGTAVAAGLVVGTVIGHRRRQRRSPKP